jgi:hypothetical protein
MFALYVRRREKPWRRSQWRKDRVSFDMVATSDEHDELVRIVRKQYGGRKEIDWFIVNHAVFDK